MAGQSFNRGEFFAIKPNDRFCLAIYKLDEFIDTILDDTLYLKMVERMETKLVALYTPEVNKPIPPYKTYSLNYLSWREEFEKKILESGENNPLAIAKEKRNRLNMIMKENGLVGGSDVAATGVISDSEDNLMDSAVED